MNVTKKHIRRRNNTQIEEINKINKKKAEGNDMTVDTLINNSNIRAMVVLVTPEIASEWLKSNTNNRRLKPSVVNSYAKDMKCGRWTLNNDAITFDKSGILTNGQHRLTAIIKSETSQEMAVMYGVEHNINMDRPAMRSVGDNLSIFSDLPDILTRKHCVSMCNFLRKMVNDETFVEKSSYGIYDFIKENQKDLLDFFTEIGVHNPSKGQKSKFNNATVMAAFYLAYINGVELELLKNMKHVMYTGEYLFPNYNVDRFLPMVKLDRALMNFDTRGDNKRFEIFLRTMYAIKSVDEGKYLRNNNKPIDEVCYEFTYRGKKISDCCNARIGC